MFGEEKTENKNCFIRIFKTGYIENFNNFELTILK